MVSRNKNHTKEKILSAAKVILERDGFVGLKVNALADEAGVGKPLIYRYFTNLDGVIFELSKGLAPSFFNDSFDPAKASSDEVVKKLVLAGRELASDRLSRDILLWSMAANGAPSPVAQVGWAAKESDSVSKKEAAFAMLKAAVAFMVMYRDRYESWQGVGIASANEMAHLENVVSEMIVKFWEE